jgi:methionyl-tRNA formyltransferase
VKALIVTSEVTYVPRNYADLFVELVAGAREHLAGLMVLSNAEPKLWLKVMGLGALGCRNMAGTLAKNLVSLRQKSREKIFESAGLPVYRASTMNEPAVIDWVRDQSIDLIVNVRTRCIYRRDILKAPRLGCLNIHHGLLPEYRGTLCDLYALYERRPAGFTIHVMNEKVDAGQILVRKAVSQGDDRNYLDYLARTGAEEGRALAALLNDVAALNSLPEGVPNSCAKPIYTRNPNRKQIAQIRKAGMVL